MKRWIVGTCLAASALLVGAVALEGAPKKGASVTVRVLSAKVMAKPKFIGKTVATVSRGDHLVYQGKRGGWYQVQSPAGSGWIHKSSVVDKKIELSSELSSGSGSGASDEELELAGRGFTKDVEKDYRANNEELDFAHVDRIEALSTSPEDVARFADTGDVGGAL